MQRTTGCGRRVIVFFSLSCVLIIMSASATYVFSQEVPAKNYVIGAEDILTVTVWGHEDLTRTVTVSADGYFSFPLIGRLKAGGLTIRNLETKIAKLLNKDYIVDPQVTIAIEAFRSKKVFILGEIVKPGSSYLSKTDTLLEVISKAGGVTQDAGREIIIVRPAKGSLQQPTSLNSKDSQLLHVNLQALLAGDIQKNIPVQNNDTIYVPKTSIFSVFGEVRKPGSYPLEKDITLLEAISTAGGPTQDADSQKIELLRTQNGVQRKIIFNIKQLLQAGEGAKEFQIQDGDVIYQPQAEYFFVMGEVKNPGSYKLEEGMTITKAISIAGGFTERASKGKVQIIRDENSKQVKHRAKSNELIQAQDIIEVPQSFF